MHGIIVLEGPDCVGKTALAEKLVKALDGHYMHLTYRWPKHMFTYHTAAIKRAARLSYDKPVILDRWWPSELIYAANYRNGSDWPFMWRMMDRVLLKHAGVYIYCLPNTIDETVARHAKLKGERSEMYEDISSLCHLYLDHWQVTARHFPHALKYRIEVEGQNNNLARFVQGACGLLRYQTGTQYQPALQYHLKNFLGHTKYAHYVFIGDEPNHKGREKLWPFYAYRDSSLWLAEALDKINWNEWESCWFNANDDQGYQLAKELVDIRGLRPIIMGKKALAKLETWRINLTDALFMNHPQYYRRFNPHFNLRGIFDGDF